MNACRFAFAFTMLTLVFLLPVNAVAFDLVDMQPHYGRYEVFTDEPLTLVFDSSLDAGTVGADAIVITSLNTGGDIAGVITLETTTLTNDTLLFVPDGGVFPFAERLQVTLDDALRDIGANAFTGELPDLGVFVANIPNDFERPQASGGGFPVELFVNANVLLGFDPLDPESTNPNKMNYIPGMWVTEAWKLETGDPEIVIGIVDNGVSRLTDSEYADRLWLNKGELPQPRDGVTPCDDWDCNGDGRFNARDYINDPDVTDTNSNGWLEPEDLINLFSDDIDQDGNGLPDDICGWDFFRNVNTPLGVSEFPEGTHANLRAKDAVAIADNGQGNKPGVCPDCTVMLVRVGEAILTELNILTAGFQYAVDMGADVVMVAMGVPDYSRESEDIFVEAFENDILTIGASGNELGFHHLSPAAGEDIYSVKGIFPLPPVELFGPVDLSILAFVESYCTNHGAHIDSTSVTGACTSESVSDAAGIAGLILSYAKHQGIDLSSGELKQLLNMTADDIKANCFAFNLQGCKKGWEQNFGYGRLNAYQALLAIGDPLFGVPERIPPEVRITGPRWWTTIDAAQTPTFDVEGQIYARGRNYDYTVEIGFGVEPDNRDFIVVQEGSGKQPTDGVLATINIAQYVDEAWLRRKPEDSNDFTITLRVRAWWKASLTEKVYGEARKAIAWHVDDDPETGSLPGFPIEIGASGESSPLLVDLDGDADGALEIVFGTARPSIEVYKRDAETGQYAVAPGFPVEIPTDRDYLDSIIGSLAVGQLFGDGDSYIVAATWHGLIYVIHPDGNLHDGGPFLDGFPVSADEPDNSSPLAYGHGNAFLASPALADLDNDGLLDIVAASYDQQAYAWKITDEDKDGEADRMPGWPVPLFSDADHGLVGPDKLCESVGPAQIIGTPVAAILDADHPDPDISGHPSVIVATTETCIESMLPTSRVYAIYWNGLENDNGPFLPDWPAKTMAPLGDALPIPPLTIGSTSSPAAINYQGELQVGVGSFFWFPQMIHWANDETYVEHLNSRVNISVSGNGSFGRFDESGIPWYFFPTAGVLNETNGEFYLIGFNVVGWRLDDPNEHYFRQHFDDINFFVNPVNADLDGDGLNEMIAGSGGYLVHATNVNMAEPAGWPKFTQNWIIASPVIGDLDGNGSAEVVAVTHEGNLFAWRTRAPACTEEGINGDWPRFHHDPYNSGMSGLDAVPPRMVRNLAAYDTDDADTFELHLTAPGDDGDCGTAALYELRYTTDANADLRDPDTWQAAEIITAPTPEPGGSELVFTVEAPGAVAFALRAYDDEGLMSPVSNVAEPTASPDDDDDDDDTGWDDDTVVDDDAIDDDDDDDDNDDGCGC